MKLHVRSALLNKLNLEGVVVPCVLPRVILVIILLTTALSCTNITYVSETHIPTAPDTNDKELAVSGKKTFFFPEDGVYLSSEFDGGRIGQVRRDAPGKYEILIGPENVPINDSPWYAFKVWSVNPQEVSIFLSYEQGTHRYHPKISTDTKKWTPLSDAQYGYKIGYNQAKMIIEISETPTWISAQELMTSNDILNWAEGIAQLPFVKLSTIGKSALQNPILKIEIGSGKSVNRKVVILGRQHPAEVTGSFALMAFIEAICGDSQLAKSFREEYQIVLFPLLNPDGVNLGHWRHNSRGVDLNRDWLRFQQSETQMVRAELERYEIGEIIAALDFHSTYEDIFYLMEGREITFEETWIRRIAKELPDYEFRIQLVAVGAPVAMNWLSKRFDIPVVTYEVGDDTPQERIKQISIVAAENLMDMLLAIDKQPVAHTL